MREKALEILEAATYPAREVNQHPFGQLDAEIEATLYATAVNSEELDQAIRALEALPDVSQAFWNSSVED